MAQVEPRRLKRSCKCYSCNYWLTGPCCLLRQKVFPAVGAFLLFTFLLTFPQATREQELGMSDDDLMASSSSEEPTSAELMEMDNIWDSILPYLPSTPSPSSSSSSSSASSTSSVSPDVISTIQSAPAPSLKQPPRSRFPGRDRGKDRHHHHAYTSHQQESKLFVTVNTPLGKIRGRTYYINKTGNYVGGFLGIRYAQGPPERFKPPKSLPSLTSSPNETFNATEFGPICIQPSEQKIWDVLYLRKQGPTVKKRKLNNYNMSEDCLTLNIYVPLKAQLNVPSALPVFFFIHGGSYYMNAGRLYPGQILASVQNILVVTSNYRLGPFGFLSTEDSAATGNYGLLDQAMALDWVYQNIQHFGGDPNRITLVGNSAGAASVMFHMFSDLSKGKFVGVTVQSGCSGAPWAIQLSPRKHARDLARKLGCPTSPSEDMVECIRVAPPEIIMKKAKLEDGLSLAYATVIDGKYGGKFLMDHPESLIRSRAFHPVPVLTGFTKDEVTIWFTKFGPDTNMKDLRSFVQVDVVSLMESLPTVTQANMAAMIHSVTVQYLYRAGARENDTSGKTGSISDFISDVGLKAPCIKEMNLLEKFNPKPVYLYEFTYFSVDDEKMERKEWIGAYHESELQFLFGETYMNYSNHLRSFDDKKMSDFMMRIWGNFARYGNPNPNPNKTDKNGLKLSWTNYTEYNQDFAVLSLKPHMSKYFLTDRMLFWNFFFPIFRDYPFHFNPTTPCDEWEIISRSWTFWALLLVTLASGFILSMLIMMRVKRKLFSRLRTNNNSTSSSAGTAPTNTGSSIAPNHNNLHHHHHLHHQTSLSGRDSCSINHRHSSATSSSSFLVGRNQHGNGGGGGGGTGSSSHLLHGANGTRLLSSSSSTTSPGGGSNVPINM